MTEWFNKTTASKQGPNLLKKIKPPSHKQFTFMILEEYLLLILTAGICYYFSYHDFYASVIIAYNIHILVHIGQALFFRSYVPGLVFGVLSFIVLSIILSFYVDLLNHQLVFLFTPISLLLLSLNLILIHKLIK